MGATDPWAGAEVLRTYPDGGRMLRISTEEHLRTLSEHQSNCAEAHAFWADGKACEPLEYFFVVVGPDNHAHATVHCKDAAWLGKPHPLDHSEEMRVRTKFIGGYVHSTRYEHEYNIDTNSARNRVEYMVAYHEKVYREAKAEFEQVKKEALAIAPLGATHPMKHRVDIANRQVSSCYEMLLDAQFQQSFYEGMRFKFGDKELCVLAYVTRGYHTTRITRDRHTEKFAEFLGGRAI